MSDEVLRRAAAHASRWLAGLKDRPVGPAGDPAGLRGPLPEDGEDPAAVIDGLAAAAEPGLVASAGPRYFGFVTGATLPAAVGADWLTPRSPRRGARIAATRVRSMLIEGARALVCGGASGLGAATARRLRAGGAHVTIADVNAERGEALAAELGAPFVQCDVTNPAQVDEAVIAARGEGVLRIAVTCAGIGWAEKTAGRRGPHSVEPFHKVIEVNLLGSFHLLRAAGAAMLANEPDDGGEAGVIVLTASIAAYDGQIGQLAYAASKGGVVAMTLPAARDLAANRIRVCAIAPGLFDTSLLAGLPEEARDALGAQVPHPARLGRPDEYAALAAHVVENPMLNGEVVRLDGALRMPPR